VALPRVIVGALWRTLAGRLGAGVATATWDDCASKRRWCRQTPLVPANAADAGKRR